MSETTKHPTSPSRHASVHPSETPLLVAVPDAARLLGIGATLAWDLVRAGGIPSVKLGHPERQVGAARARPARLAGASCQRVGRPRRRDRITRGRIRSRVLADGDGERGIVHLSPAGRRTAVGQERDDAAPMR